MAMRNVAGSLLMALLFLAMPVTTTHAVGVQGMKDSGAIVSAGMPSLDRYVSRLSTRSEHLLGRFGAALQSAGLVWIWLLLSTAVFTIVVALASVIDMRMMDLRQFSAHRFGVDVRHGVRLFFRISIDRRMPNLPRLLLAIGLLYWLAPVDLIPDSSWVPGFIDDVLIAILVSKTFIYLCPAALMARHAHAVEGL
ncbi:MAG: DUF1232 domain-containing protein [Deltaproteobacteria bacterium]|nr:DUF1232 domain-containing protein [Deltaproteobacteria bacterium]